MSAMALIGLTSYPKNDAGQYVVPGEYVDAVRRAGGTPVVIPPGESDPEGVCERLDALVLIGGGDIDPSRYGSSAHETIYNVNEERDLMELRLANWVLEKHMPTLAICRGLQVVNVALGGTLNTHLPDLLGEDVLHRAPPRDPIDHEHHVVGGSTLGKVLGESTFSARSWHHQSVKTLAPGFRAVATAPDGCVEAIEHPERPELFCVQWHPELSAANDPIQQRLFNRLVELARQR